MTSPDPWNPGRYLRFGDERSAPFHDLLALLEPGPPAPRVVDLGCGTGALTALAHARLGATGTLGIDASPAMLARAAEQQVAGLRFAQGDLGTPDLGTGGGSFDVVLSNAALHWVPDHHALLPRLVALLAPGGTLAVQVPANQAHPSQRLALRVAGEEPFASALGGWLHRTPVLEPEDYVLALHRLGLTDVSGSTRVYLHQLPDRGALLDWMSGTTLTAYERRLEPAVFADLRAAYGAALAAELPDERPYPFTFRRLFFRARRPPA